MERIISPAPDRTLIVGCGLRPMKGAVNLDKYDLPGVTCKFDLNIISSMAWTALSGRSASLPFADDYFERIEAEDVLEHVDDIVAVVNELGRVLKVGGVLWIRGPDSRYPEQVWADPTHKRAFAVRSFDGWDRSTYDGKHYGYYFHQNKVFFKVTGIVERNKGLEFTLVKEAP